MDSSKVALLDFLANHLNDMIGKGQSEEYDRIAILINETAGHLRPRSSSYPLYREKTKQEILRERPKLQQFALGGFFIPRLIC